MMVATWQDKERNVQGNRDTTTTGVTRPWEGSYEPFGPPRITDRSRVSVVVARAAKDRDRPVELLSEQQAYQLMREGHR